MEGLKLTNAELLVYIHPSKSGNKLKAICRELSSLLFQFVPFNLFFKVSIFYFWVNLKSYAL